MLSTYTRDSGHFPLPSDSDSSCDTRVTVIEAVTVTRVKGPLMLCRAQRQTRAAFERRQRARKAASLQISLPMFMRSISMLLPHAPLPLILLFALSFCCNFGAGHSDSGSSYSNGDAEAVLYTPLGYGPSCDGCAPPPPAPPPSSSSCSSSSSPPLSSASRLSALTHPQHLVGSFWDVPLPTLHEKIYGKLYHHRQYQHHHQSRYITTLPAFAYISSSISDNNGHGYAHRDYNADVSIPWQ